MPEKLMLVWEGDHFRIWWKDERLPLSVTSISNHGVLHGFNVELNASMSDVDIASIDDMPVDDD